MTPLPFGSHRTETGPGESGRGHYGARVCCCTLGRLKLLSAQIIQGEGTHGGYCSGLQEAH